MAYIENDPREMIKNCRFKGYCDAVSFRPYVTGIAIVNFSSNINILKSRNGFKILEINNKIKFLILKFRSYRYCYSQNYCFCLTKIIKYNILIIKIIILIALFVSNKHTELR